MSGCVGPSFSEHTKHKVHMGEQEAIFTLQLQGLTERQT